MAPLNSTPGGVADRSNSGRPTVDQDGTALGPRVSVPGTPDQVRLHIYRRTEEMLRAGHERNDLIRTLAGLQRRQAALRTYCRRVLGGWPAPRPAPPADIVRVIRRQLWQVEPVLLGSAADGHITGALYRPRPSPPRPGGAVLFLCGHAKAGKAAPLYQGFCQRLAAHGLTVLAIDSIGQGERVSYLDRHGAPTVQPNVQEHTYAGVPCWWTGDTIARYFVDDACRALDFLESLPQVDPTRIGVAGNSGGGTQATWLMMGEPRIAAAAPGCFIMSRSSYLWTDEAQDPEQILPGGTVAGIDHEDFLLAMAPRPTLVMSADDDFFPISGAQWTVARAQRYFAIAGAPDNLRHARVAAGHGLHPDLARDATEFFVGHLGDGRPLLPFEPTPLDEWALRATRTGQVRLDCPTTPLVHERNRLRLSVQSDTDDSQRAERAVEWLAEQVGSTTRPACPPNPQWTGPHPWGHGVGSHSVWWWSEPGIKIAAEELRPDQPIGTTVIALFDRGSDDRGAHRDRCATWLDAGHRVLMLDVRGTGAARMRRINNFSDEETYGTTYKLMTDLFWLSDSLAACRVHDVLTAIDLVCTDARFGTNHVQIFGVGHGGFYGFLAAALDQRVTRTEIDGQLFDPARVVTTRLYPPGRDLQLVLPGMAVNCPVADLVATFRERTFIIHDPAAPTNSAPLQQRKGT